MGRMPVTRLGALGVVTAVAVGAVPAVAAAEPTAVTGVQAATPIAAYQGRLVWSRPDGTGAFELVQRVGDGPVTKLPVAPRAVPFDVDLGPTAGGRVLAVYSRCTTEPAPAPGLSPEGISYETGRGCDVYKVDPAGGGEARYTGASSPAASEVWPTYWKGRLGFVRRYDDQRDVPYLYVKEVSGSAPSMRMTGGPRGTPPSRSTATDLELYGTRLGYRWRYAGTTATGTTFELRVDTVGGAGRRIDRRAVGLTAIITGWPAFEDGRVYWSRGCFGDPAGCTSGVSELRTGTYTGTPLTDQRARGPRFVLAHERDAGVTWVLTDSPVVESTQWCGTSATCSIQPLRPAYAPSG